MGVCVVILNSFFSNTRMHCNWIVHNDLKFFNNDYSLRHINGSPCWTIHCLKDGTHTQYYIFFPPYFYLYVYYMTERSTNSNIGHDQTASFACIVLITNDLSAWRLMLYISNTIVFEMSLVCVIFFNRYCGKVI